ncbi:hypothetical protein ACFHYQ_26165 [Sphaerimonospora cavernae]|uniref:Uncharacterized protein n=1 Tax=Sphaerimonospora cavernae TaxID=1740611 RepID=A0ABV6UCD3_9ACTN
MLCLYDTVTERTEPIVPPGSRVLRMRVHVPGHDPRGEAGRRSARLDELRPLLLADLVRRTAERQRLHVLAVHDGEPPRDETLALNIRPQEHPPPPAGADVRIDLHVGAVAPGIVSPGRWTRTGRVGLPGEPDASYLSDVSDAGLDPLAVRLAFLEHRYRRPVELTWDHLRAADETLRRWRRRVAEWAESPSRPIDEGHAARIQAALDDDLDTSLALRLLADLADAEPVPPGARFETFLHFDHILGLDLPADIGKI